MDFCLAEEKDLINFNKKTEVFYVCNYTRLSKTERHGGNVKFVTPNKFMHNVERILSTDVIFWNLHVGPTVRIRYGTRTTFYRRPTLRALNSVVQSTEHHRFIKILYWMRNACGVISLNHKKLQHKWKFMWHVWLPNDATLADYLDC